MPINYAQVAKLASDGSSLRTIAEQLGIRWGTFLKRRKVDDELEAAIRAGWGQERTELVGKLRKIAKEGSDRDASRAIMFLLKAKHGWREGEVADQGSVNVGIVINLPDTSNEEDARRRLIEVRAKGLGADVVDAEEVTNADD